MWIGVPRIESSRDAGISADEEATVRRQPLPGEERAVVAGEEECGGGDLPRVTGAPERCTGDHRRPDQRRHRLGHRRVDVAWADRVDPDPTGGDIPRHGAREGEDPALRRRVVWRRLEPREGRNARQVDDRAPVPLAHQADRLAGTEEGPVEMHGEHPSPRFVGEVLGDVEVGLRALPAHHLHDPRLGLTADPRAVVAGAHGDARVVHEDIERAELALYGREHRVDLGALRHVGLDRAAAGRPLHLRHGLLGHLEAHVVDDDARALLREKQRNRAPEPRASTCHQRDAVRELHRPSPAITLRPPGAGAPQHTLGRRVSEVKAAGTRDAEIVRLRPADACILGVDGKAKAVDEFIDTITPSYALGIDIGGTFTDIVVYDHDSGRQWSRKVLTTHDDPVRAVAAGVATVLGDGRLESRHFTRVVHATTLFTNALIERKGAVTGLITTAGFGDTLEIGRERKFDLYDLDIAKPEPLVPRQRRQEVRERVGADGRVRVKLDVRGVEARATRLVRDGATS